MIDKRKTGERIAKLRKEHGLTGEKFAELLNVSPQAVSKWETGKNLPETALLPDISKLLGESIDSILASEAYPVKLHLGGHYIDGIPPLQSQSGDCTWAGAVKILLDVIGIHLTYPEIMGFSGTCYYFSMTDNWCPSAMMPQIEYNPDDILEKAVGAQRASGTQRTSFFPKKLDRQVKESIRRGMPVMLIEPRVEMEWGVLCGYTGDGKFYGRSYFDNLHPDEKEIFTHNNYFLADKYPGADPGLIYFLSGRTEPLPLDKALKASLETAKHLYTAKPRGNYVFGIAAYDILIDGLHRDDAGFASITQYGATENGITLLTRLIDARRAAHAFWVEKSQHLPAANARKMRDVAELYFGVVSVLGDILPDDFISARQNGYPFKAWSEDTRARLADVLTTCKQLEQQARDIIAEVLAHW